MATKKYSQLTETATLADTDIVSVVAGGNSRKATISTLRTEMLENITATEAELSHMSGVTSAVQTQLDAKADIASPALTGAPTAPTVSLGDSTTKIATTAFVTGTSLAASLPGQTDNDGKYITTDGATASWQSPYNLSVKSANYTAVNGDLLLVDAESSDITITLPATPTAGDWVRMRVYVDATTVTIGRSGENIESLAEDMEITNDISFDIAYLNATRGWVLV